MFCGCVRMMETFNSGIFYVSLGIYFTSYRFSTTFYNLFEIIGVFKCLGNLMRDGRPKCMRIKQ